MSSITSHRTAGFGTQTEIWSSTNVRSFKLRGPEIRNPVPRKHEEREVEFDVEWEKTLAQNRPANKIKASAYPG